RIALAERTVTCVILPKDVQELAYEEPPRKHDTVHTSVGYVPPIVVPSAAELERAAEVLNAGEKVAILVGAGAMGADFEIAQIANTLGAGVAKALLGRAVIADDLPFVTGAIGLLGTRPSWDMMQGCDTLLVVGSSFPYSEFLPKEGQARGVQIDIDPKVIGMRYPMELNLVGDAKATLAALTPLLLQKPHGAWRKSIEDGIQSWWDLTKKRAFTEAKPINPQRLFWELSPRLPVDCMITADSGSTANWFARDLRMKPTMTATLSGGLATMGCGVPYAIAGKFAHSERVAIACVGDGAMQMNGMAELLTVVRYWKEWRDPRFVVIVMNNGDLNMVTWEMRVMAGDTRYEASQDLPAFNYAAFADLIGLRGIRVETPDAIAPALDQAFLSDRPVVVDVVVDPNVPPLPPHITFEQAKSFMMSVVKGDPERGGYIRQALENMFPSLAQKP
ncbi:MAG TPA: thiamine pyrophosphate-dependent enzyme, partial [Labilithrix sp.]